jgi:2-polyprenyl-6-methoxyphenol hydroxylase-like FAD-dependent oxidoreductase
MDGLLAAAAGTDIQTGLDIRAHFETLGGADLVVGADAINSAVRAKTFPTQPRALSFDRRSTSRMSIDEHTLTTRRLAARQAIILASNRLLVITRGRR